MGIETLKGPWTMDAVWRTWPLNVNRRIRNARNFLWSLVHKPFSIRHFQGYLKDILEAVSQRVVYTEKRLTGMNR